MEKDVCFKKAIWPEPVFGWQKTLKNQNSKQFAIIRNYLSIHPDQPTNFLLWFEREINNNSIYLTFPTFSHIKHKNYLVFIPNNDLRVFSSFLFKSLILPSTLCLLTIIWYLYSVSLHAFSPDSYCIYL